MPPKNNPTVNTDAVNLEADYRLELESFRLGDSLKPTSVPEDYPEDPDAGYWEAKAEREAQNQ